MEPTREPARGLGSPGTGASSGSNRRAHRTEPISERRRMVDEAALHVRRIPTVIALAGFDISDADALWIVGQHAHRADLCLRAAA